MRVPSLAEIVEAGVSSGLARVHVALPGIVHSYDSATQTAHVIPAIKAPVFDTETGERGPPDTLPIIPNVPVMFPRGGGFCCVFPLSQGDEVTLVFNEFNTSEFRTTGQVSEPTDVRRHGLGSPVAIPSAISDIKALTDHAAAASAMLLGKDGQEGQVRIAANEIKLGATASQYVALANLVNARCAAIETFLASHTHGGVTTGTGVSATAPGAPSGSSVAATVVKAK